MPIFLKSWFCVLMIFILNIGCASQDNYKALDMKIDTLESMLKVRIDYLDQELSKEKSKTENIMPIISLSEVSRANNCYFEIGLSEINKINELSYRSENYDVKNGEYGFCDSVEFSCVIDDELIKYENYLRKIGDSKCSHLKKIYDSSRLNKSIFCGVNITFQDRMGKFTLGYCKKDLSVFDLEAVKEARKH